MAFPLKRLGQSCLRRRVCGLTRPLDDPCEVEHVVFAGLDANTLWWGVFELGNFAHEAAHDSGR